MIGVVHMKKILVCCLIFLTVACSNKGNSQNTPVVTTTSTTTTVVSTTVTTTPKVTTTTSQKVPTLPDGDIHFFDILPENVKDVTLEIENINIELTDEVEKKNFLNHIINIPLHSEFEEGNHLIGAYMATLIVVDEDLNNYTYTEGGSDILTVRRNRDKSKMYGYYPKGGEYSGFKLYLTKYANGILEPYRIGLEESQYTDYLQILELETENYTISSKLGDTTFTYTYDNLINSFEFNPKNHGLQIYENDIEYEELPNSPGKHLVILKKENISYQLAYSV